jgi:homoserine dehydrogenase
MALRIGLLGCGTVGGGVLKLLKANAASLEARVGAKLEVARVLVRDEKKERVAELDKKLMTTNAEDVLGDASIDIVIEVMGGADSAKAYVERAIDAKKQVVTANKMLLALHGAALIERAREKNVDLAFEASVGGGIPIVRTLRDALAGDEAVSIAGIVNGTSNYILTCMQKEGLAFDVALKAAQEKGYAEADPALDIGGGDAAHKLVVLAMLAFGAKVDHKAVLTEGITSVDAVDHAFAERFGFVVKHLAIGRRQSAGLELRVHSALVPKDTPLANVSGVLNAIAVEGKGLGPCLLSGRGAGDLPTAVSVVADVVDVARAKKSGITGLSTQALKLKDQTVLPMDHVTSRYYLRFQVLDEPGVLGKITGALGEAKVSIEQLVQQGGGGGTGLPVQVVMLTHIANEKNVQSALRAIEKQSFVAKPTQLLRVHDG